VLFFYEKISTLSLRVGSWGMSAEVAVLRERLKKLLEEGEL